VTLAIPTKRPSLFQPKDDAALVKAVAGWTPRSALGLTVMQALPYLPEDLALELADRIRSTAIIESSLRVTVKRFLGLAEKGLIDPRDVKVEDYGVVSVKVVTTVGCGFIVDAFQNTVELENMKFHALGTGSTAEAVGDTALVTELTTEYTGNVRATGTTTEFSALVYQTVATNTLDSGTPNLREHGILTQAATGGGTLLDRSVFAGIALDGTVGDALTTDYRFTLTAGG
jgi:hypothetical protein